MNIQLRKPDELPEKTAPKSENSKDVLLITALGITHVGYYHFPSESWEVYENPESDTYPNLERIKFKWYYPQVSWAQANEPKREFPRVITFLEQQTNWMKPLLGSGNEHAEEYQAAIELLKGGEG